jgi:hypothetical protein
MPTPAFATVWGCTGGNLRARLGVVGLRGLVNLLFSAWPFSFETGRPLRTLAFAMRHPRFKKVLLIALGVGSLLLALAVLMFPRFVRGVVDDLERRRGIRITYQSMRPSLGGITFGDAEVSAGTEVYASARAISVHVDWWSRRPTRIVVHNAVTRLAGTPEAVRTRVRGQDGAAGGGAADTRRLSVELLDGSLAWSDLSPTTRSLAGEGVTALLGDAACRSAHEA